MKSIPLKSQFEKYPGWARRTLKKRSIVSRMKKLIEVIDNEQLEGDFAIFLKTNFKQEFYAIREANSSLRGDLADDSNKLASLSASLYINKYKYKT